MKTNLILILLLGFLIATAYQSVLVETQKKEILKVNTELENLRNERQTNAEQYKADAIMFANYAEQLTDYLAFLESILTPEQIQQAQIWVNEHKTQK